MRGKFRQAASGRLACVRILGLHNALQGLSCRQAPFPDISGAPKFIGSEMRSVVAHQPLQHTPFVSFSPTFSNDSQLRCPICDRPIPVETAKTDKSGIAFHEECYVLKVELKRASGTKIRGANMIHLLRMLWLTDEGQDIAEYAVMLAVILVLVVGTVRFVGSNSNNAFSSVASSLQ